MVTLKRAGGTLSSLYLLIVLMIFQLQKDIVAQTANNANLASPNSIVFQLRSEETKYAEGEWASFRIEVTNLWTTQDTMYLSLYFPHIYEQLLGNEASQKFFQYHNTWKDQLKYYIEEDGLPVSALSLGIELYQETFSQNQHGHNATDSVTWKINGMERNASFFIEFQMQILSPLEFEDKTLAANLGLMMFDKEWDPYPTYSGFTLHILQSPCSWFGIVHNRITADAACFFGEEIEYQIVLSYIAQESLDSLNLECHFPGDAMFIGSNPPPISQGDSSVVWGIGKLEAGETDTMRINYRVVFTGVPEEAPYDSTYLKINHLNMSFSDGSDFCGNTDEFCYCLLPYPDFEPQSVRALVNEEECASPGYPVTLTTQIYNHARNWDAGDDLVICFFNQANGEFIGSVPFTDSLGYESESEDISLIWESPPENPESVVEVFVNCDSSVQELNYENNQLNSESFCVQVTELNANMFSLGYRRGGFGVQTSYPENILGYWHVFDQNNNPILAKANADEWLTQDSQNERGELMADVFTYQETRQADTPESWMIPAFSTRESQNLDSGFEITVLAAENSQDVRTAAADFVGKLPDKDFAYMKTYTGPIIPELQSTAQEMAMHDTKKIIFLFASDVEIAETDSIHHISNLSREYNIPVYTIALDNVNEMMQQIADSTMGIHWNIALDQANDFNTKLVDILHHCYVFHYSAPYEGEYSHFWHTLDASLSYATLQSQDTAWYLEPYGDPDLVISKQSMVDGVRPDSGIIASTDVITYEIYVENRGILSVTDVVIQDRLPDRIVVDQASVSNGGVLTQDSTGVQILTWNVAEIGPEAVLTFTFDCELDTSWSTWDMCSQITNIAHIDTASIDQDLSNNTAMDVLTVHVDYGDPVAYTDQSLYIPREAVTVGCVSEAPCTEWRVVATQADGSTQEFTGVFY